MNRAARRHLLGVLERASAPIHVFKVKAWHYAVELGKIQAALSASRSGAFILPAELELEFKIIPPRRSGVRVVAGKGARRLGIRGKFPPPRIVHSEQRRHGAGVWVVRRDVQLDREHRVELTEDPGGRRRRVVA